eukprot:scaffold418568_cov32-Prasinocladus_malaysianus.AAC.1
MRQSKTEQLKRGWPYNGAKAVRPRGQRLVDDRGEQTVDTQIRPLAKRDLPDVAQLHLLTAGVGKEAHDHLLTARICQYDAVVDEFGRERGCRVWTTAQLLLDLGVRDELQKAPQLRHPRGRHPRIQRLDLQKHSAGHGGARVGSKLGDALRGKLIDDNHEGLERPGISGAVDGGQGESVVALSEP